MEENFNVVAQSRANYYVPQSPVQLVRIEVLKGDVSGDNVICLTFKNVSPTTITCLDIVLRCKDNKGVLLCEKNFRYQDLETISGEMFGMDDAIFETKENVGSVEVALQRVFSGKKAMSLENLKRTPLPKLQRLEKPVEEALAKRMSKKGLNYIPKTYESGWHCACGAFHPVEENTGYCSECKSDKVLVESSLKAVIKPAQPVAPPEQVVDVPKQPTPVNTPPTPVKTQANNAELSKAQSPTVIVPNVTANNAQETVIITPPKAKPTPQEEAEKQAERTRMFATNSETTPQADVANRRAMPKTEEVKAYAKQYQDTRKTHNDDDYEIIDPRDEIAENIIRWVPVATALLCAIIAIGGFMYVTLLA